MHTPCIPATVGRRHRKQAAPPPGRGGGRGILHAASPLPVLAPVVSIAGRSLPERGRRGPGLLGRRSRCRGCLPLSCSRLQRAGRAEKRAQRQKAAHLRKPRAVASARRVGCLWGPICAVGRAPCSDGFAPAAVLFWGRGPPPCCRPLPSPPPRDAGASGSSQLHRMPRYIKQHRQPHRSSGRACCRPRARPCCTSACSAPPPPPLMHACSRAQRLHQRGQQEDAPCGKKVVVGMGATKQEARMGWREPSSPDYKQHGQLTEAATPEAATTVCSPCRRLRAPLQAQHAGGTGISNLCGLE